MKPNKNKKLHITENLPCTAISLYSPYGAIKILEAIRISNSYCMCFLLTFLLLFLTQRGSHLQLKDGHQLLVSVLPIAGNTLNVSTIADKFYGQLIDDIVL